jgi:CRP/FNR family transcriptional regulator
MAKIKPLKDCKLFRDFADKEIALISQIVSEKKIPEGTPIFVEGMLGDTLFIIRKGLVRISRNIPEVGEMELGIIENGGFFGEMALVDGGSRAVSARTLKETELLTIDREDFLKLIKKETAVAMQLVMAIAQGVTEKTRQNLALIDEYLKWRLEKGVNS